MMRRIVVACLLVLAAAAFPAASQDERFGALLGLARVKRDAGDLTAARQYFDAAHRVRPLHGSELAEYFWVLIDVDPRAATGVGQELLSAAPARADVRDALIGAAVSLADETTVVALAAEGRRVDPGTARWPRRLGESYLRAGRASMAAAAYAQAIEAADADPRDRVGLAIALEAAGDVRGAAAAWRHVPDRVTRENPEWVSSRARATAAAMPSRAAAPVSTRVDESSVADRPVATGARRGVERAVAEGSRALALEFVARMPVVAGLDQLSLDSAGAEELRSAAHEMVRHLEIAEARTRASKRWSAGDHAAAIAAATQVTRLVPDDGEAWFIRVAATASSRSRDELLSTIQTFVDAGVENDGLLIGLAEHLSGLVRSPDDPLIEASLSLLDRIRPGRTVAGVALARARVLASADRWTESLVQVERALALDPRSAPALRLRADVLSWAGRHDDAILAYEHYFTISDSDAAARRQYARVLGWSGRHTEAIRAYAALVAVSPGDPAVTAEATAKRAFFEGRWRAAVAAYREWLAVEPRNAEARFELAESLRASGDVVSADAALLVLETDYGHRLAASARARAHLNRRPSVEFSGQRRSANGYGGARLLELQMDGGVLGFSAGDGGRTRLSLEGGRVRADGETSARAGSRFRAGVASQLGTGVSVSGDVGSWQIGTGRPLVEVRGGAGWRPGDRWTLDLALERMAFYENIGTIDSRLAATGVSTALRFHAPSSSIEMRASRHTISDGNERTRITVSANRSLGGRLAPLRLLGWGEALAFGEARAAYFSPARFLRLDTGLEYVHALARPRFQGDRQGELAVGYLVGTDNRGTLYQHPLMRLAVELRPGLALEARGGWIRSSTYDERSLVVGLRLGGKEPNR